jgi:hypothetical protein
MAASGRNEGVRVLEDFVCKAIPCSGTVLPPSPGRGINKGMSVVAELSVRASQSSSQSLTNERLAEFRALSNGQLLEIVRSKNASLSSQELLAIHDIAVERLTKGSDAISDSSIELSREAMLVAINRTASS